MQRAEGLGDPLRVLYIAGVGRSGSTLLERMLGAMPGTVRRHRENSTRSFRACRPRTSAVDAVSRSPPALLDRGGRACFQRVAVGGQPNGAPSAACHSTASPTQPDDRPRTRGLPSRARGVPRHLSPPLRGDLRRSACRGRGGREQVSRAALRPPEENPDLDLRVLNLVRDSRGVANSWNKTGIRKPQSSTATRWVRTPPAARRALVCAAARVQHARDGSPACSPNAIRGSRLSPSPTLEQALNRLGMTPATGALDHVGEHSVVLASSHGVAGSRTRFITGRIDLQLDDAWRSNLLRGPAGS